MRKVQAHEGEMGYEIVVFGAIFVITERQIEHYSRDISREQPGTNTGLFTDARRFVDSPAKGSDKTDMWTAPFQITAQITKMKD